MGQLNVGYLQGTSNSGFKITLTKESTISHECDVRFLTSQSYQDLPVYGSKNFLAAHWRLPKSQKKLENSIYFLNPSFS